MNPTPFVAPDRPRNSTRNHVSVMMNLNLAHMRLFPSIHVVPLACRPSAQPIGSRQYLKLRCGWTTWMAGTSPAMAVRAMNLASPVSSIRVSRRPVSTRSEQYSLPIAPRRRLAAPPLVLFQRVEHRFRGVAVQRFLPALGDIGL